MNIQHIASKYEAMALRQIKEAHENGERAPKVLNIYTVSKRDVAEFIVPVRAFVEVREQIIKIGYAYRARLI